MHLLEVITLFLRLGATAFGGPAASIALMHSEVVARRKWLDDQRFLDLLGATNLIPGPNAVEMVIHLGFLRAGWPGLLLGGLSFILPSTLIVLLLAWVYTRFGALLHAEWILYGVKPVVIALIVKALWDLGRKTLKTPPMLLVTVVVLAFYLFGASELLLLAAGGLAGGGWTAWKRRARPGLPILLPTLGGLGAALLAQVPVSLPLMFLVFLKIGALLYGSGYVLLAFLRADFVVRLGWLSDPQLLDAVAVGQITPGPFTTTATFIGYLLGGLDGALLATLGIFLPSFIFVALSSPLIPKIRASAWAGGFLDGVNAAALGLMAAVTLQMGRVSLVDALTVLVALAAALALFRTRISSTWLIAAGALCGLLGAA